MERSTQGTGLTDEGTAVALFGREFIAVPDEGKGQILFKWPDDKIRKFSKAIVDADEIALFINKGQVIGTLPPGQHQIDANELPFLGTVIDAVTAGNAYRAELFFVGTREYTGETFGGRIDDVQDPQTGMIITLRVFGDYALKVADPAKVVLNLVGTVNATDNDSIVGWVSDQLLKVLRTTVTTEIVGNGWPVLGLSAYTPQIEQAAIDAANIQLDAYGLTIARMGNFDINLSDDDEAQLKALAKDTAYSRLAGNFNAYASGEAALGAGAGMAKGGAGTGGAFLAAGLGLGQQAGATPSPAGAVPPPAPGFSGGGPGFTTGGSTAGAPSGTDGVTCPSCHAHNADGAKFCASCGTALPIAERCPSCGTENVAGARFCTSCGAALASSSTPCANCGAEMPAGSKFCAGCGHPAGGTADPPAPGGASAGDAPAPQAGA